MLIFSLDIVISINLSDAETSMNRRSIMCQLVLSVIYLNVLSLQGLSFAEETKQVIVPISGSTYTETDYNRDCYEKPYNQL